MTKAIFVLFSLAVFASCTMPETRIYSLSMTTEKSAAVPHTDTSVVVRINSPRYLEQPYIAHRDSPYQVEIARYSKWDETPVEMVGEVLKSALRSSGRFREIRISRIVPKGFYDLAIDLRKFERFDEGEQATAQLFFDVDLTAPDGAVLYRGSVEKSVKLSEKSFAALAKGLSSALSEGVSEVRTHVERSLKQSPAR